MSHKEAVKTTMRGQTVNKRWPFFEVENEECQKSMKTAVCCSGMMLSLVLLLRFFVGEFSGDLQLLWTAKKSVTLLVSNES